MAEIGDPTVLGFDGPDGSLDDKTFSYGGQTHTVDLVLVLLGTPDNSLTLSLDATITDTSHLVLDVDGTQFAFDDASFSASHHTYSWTSSAVPTWSENDTVALALTATPTVPDAPQGFTAMAGFSLATLSWQAPGNDGGSAITGYQYQYKIGTGDYRNWRPIRDSASLTSHITSRGAGPNDTVTYKLRAKNLIGEGAATAEQSVTFGGGATIRMAETALSVAENAGEAEFRVVAETAPGTAQPDVTLEVVAVNLGLTATRGPLEDGGDFERLSVKVTFAPGDFAQDGQRWVASKAVTLTIHDDDVIEEDEEFAVFLSSDQCCFLQLSEADPGSDTYLLVTINDDDTPTLAGPGTPPADFFSRPLDAPANLEAERTYGEGCTGGRRSSPIWLTWDVPDFPRSPGGRLTHDYRMKEAAQDPWSEWIQIGSKRRAQIEAYQQDGKLTYGVFYFGNLSPDRTNHFQIRVSETWQKDDSKWSNGGGPWSRGVEHGGGGAVRRVRPAEAVGRQRGGGG